ncbi:MAG: 16S rRNA (cytidine(1402)-2'-O)-methyltransferase [Patescibacteria group bacterium]|nr:16S rRNA (cytidine(1402)-2'-O)-methyltransferase [Patescibacteria group bacterium]
MAGVLYVVATPIGNLKDITLRALETLKSVDRIVAEDTRVTAKLLARYEIRKPMFSLHARSSERAVQKVLELVADGEAIAFVTDAGTPGISDPGAYLVEKVRARAGEKSIVPIPGPSAVSAALSVSGMNADEFVFFGFPPHKKGRQKVLDEVARTARTAVLYESPHRAAKLLGELAARVPERRLVIAREMTKMFEEIAVGAVEELRGRFMEEKISGKGEFVLILGPVK